MNMITILKVEPGKFPEIKEIKDEIRDLQNEVGGSIEVVYPWPRSSVCLICNDEGKLLDLPPNRLLPEIWDVIAGPFFLAGYYHGPDGGELCSLTPEQLIKFEARFHEPLPEDIFE